MQEGRGLLASEETREAGLPSGGLQQVDAANDDVDALAPVVDGDGELIGPVPMPIAQQHVAALRGWNLALRTQPEVVECFRSRIHSYPPAVSVGERKPLVAAVARVMELRRVRPAA